MANQQPQFTRPDRTRLYGVTHTLEGAPIRRQTRSLKIGIGTPKGRDLHVWMRANGKWVVAVGKGEDGKHIFNLRSEAENAYRQLYATAPEKKYPSKLTYFTFLRPGAEGDGFVHDFDAIEAHGPIPTSVPIFFTTDQPLATGMEWWSASKLKCYGDGINALRHIELAATPEEKELAKNPIDDKYFPIIGGCAQGGCLYCVDAEDAKTGKPLKRVCKPHSKLVLQLANIPSIGSTTTFDTTGFQSTGQLSSSLNQVTEITQGKAAGIPLDFVLYPYVRHPDGKKTTLYAPNIEFHPKTIKEALQITQTMMGYVNAYRAEPQLVAAAQQQLQIGAAPTADLTDEEEESEAQTLDSEFQTADRQEGSAEAAADIGKEKVEKLRKKGATIKDAAEPEKPAEAKTETKPEPEIPTSETAAVADPEEISDANEDYITDDDVPEILRPRPATQPAAKTEDEALSRSKEPAYTAALRELEVKMKTLKAGGKFKDILGAHGYEAIEDVPRVIPALTVALNDAIAEIEKRNAEAPKKSKIELPK